MADAQLAALLEIEPGSPVLVMTQLVYDSADRPFMWSVVAVQRRSVPTAHSVPTRRSSTLSHLP